MNPPSGREWRDHATCREVDPEIFFPEKGQTPHAAKRVCAVCPVCTECLTDALTRRDTAYGVLGGMTPRERREQLQHQAGDLARSATMGRAA